MDTKRNTDVTDVIERVTKLMHEQTQSQEGTTSQKKISSSIDKRDRQGPVNSRDFLLNNNTRKRRK